MDFSISFTEEGKLSLKGIHIDNQSKVKRALRELSKDLSLGKELEGRLKGFYSLRVGNYRVIYSLRENSIIVHHVGHRKDVYNEVEKR